MDQNFDKALAGKYSGDGPGIFRLAFVTSLLTLLTVGIYRFWAKTRIRKYIWSSVSLEGDSFEYTGTGLEKLLGFLVAIVVLALYLAVVQMVLFFFGMNMFSEPASIEEMVAQMGATYLTIFAVAPLWFFATYRARRYKLARTRWRSIRFGMEKGAWGYAFRAIGHWLLTISTLGLLLPRQTFYLEKYMTDRSWYGSAQFTQGGKWTALYSAMKHIFVAIGIVLLGGALLAMENAAIGVVLLVVGYIWGAVGLVYYRVRAFAYLTDNKALGGGIEFRANPSTRTLIGIVLLGGLAIGVAAAVLFGAAGTVIFGAALSNGAVPSGAIAVFAVLFYLAAFLVIGALSLALVTQPVIRHVVETLSLPDARGLGVIRQRAHDDGADAEGFADALDVGGAI